MINLDIERRFTYHDVGDIQAGAMSQIRDAFKAAADVVEKRCKPSRERSAALTNLEQASFWAVASIARDGVDMTRGGPE